MRKELQGDLSNYSQSQLKGRHIINKICKCSSTAICIEQVKLTILLFLFHRQRYLKRCETFSDKKSETGVIQDKSVTSSFKPWFLTAWIVSVFLFIWFEVYCEQRKDDTSSGYASVNNSSCFFFILTHSEHSLKRASIFSFKG